MQHAASRHDKDLFHYFFCSGNRPAELRASCGVSRALYLSFRRASLGVFKAESI